MLTEAAVLLLAAQCQCMDPALCPDGKPLVPVTLIRDIAWKESRFNPLAVNHNKNGTDDRGLMQVNASNDEWLHLTNPFDPCQSIHAAATYLASVSKYNRGPASTVFAASYVADVVEGKRQSVAAPATVIVLSLTDQVLTSPRRK